MRLAILGATGRTGRHLVELALAAGHEVIAVTRETTPTERRGVTWVVGSVLHEETVDDAISGAEAAIVVLGPSSEAPDVCSHATRLTVEACHRHDVKRLVVLTGAMIGHPVEALSWWFQAMRASWRATHPHAAHERDEQERLVRDSGLDWTLLHPPRLTDGPGGPHDVGTDLAVGANDHADRIDVARVALEAATSSRWSGQGIAIVGR